MKATADHLCVVKYTLTSVQEALALEAAIVWWRSQSFYIQVLQDSHIATHKC